MKLSELAEKLGLEYDGDGGIEILGPATLKSAGPENISFYANKKYREQLLTTRAGAVVIAPKDVPPERSFAVVLSENPLDDFRRVVELFFPPENPEPFISPKASISPRAKIGKNVRIEDFAVVGAAQIGDGVVIGAQCYVGDGVVIGDGTRLFPQVVIYHDCVIGKNVIIHSGAVIGADGFGYSRTPDGVYHKIPQVGRVVIGDNVEIGANTTIDRGALDDTIIGDGTKIDNLVQIGHNVVMGKNCAIAGQAGIAGSCILGDGVRLGGQSGLAGHLELGNDVTVYAQSGVDKSFGDGAVIWGSPARPAREMFRQLAALTKLPDLLKKIR